MNAWAGKAIQTILCLFLVGAIGCAPAKTIWTSDPDAGIASNSQFEARLIPLKRNDDFYTAFRLEVKNLTGSDLSIDWNKTLYIHDGLRNGLFVFEDITPEDVKNRSIPTDTIPPGSTFTKEVAPFKLLSKAPAWEEGKTEGIRGGILPEGENGMQLVILREGEPLVETLTVRLTEQEMP